MDNTIIKERQDALIAEVLKDVEYALEGGIITDKEQVFKFCYHRAKFQREVQERINSHDE